MAAFPAPDARHRPDPGAFAGRLSSPSERAGAVTHPGHLQFEALISTARLSANPNGFAMVAFLGRLGLRIFEAYGASIADLGEEYGHRVLRVRGKGGKVAHAIDRAVNDGVEGPILRNALGARMYRHVATRRLKGAAADT